MSATQETGRRRRTELPRSSRCRAHHHESRDKHDDRARRRLTIEERVRRADRERLVKSEPPIECPRITSPVTAVASRRRRAPQTARTDPQRGSHGRPERLDRVATAPRVSRRQRRTPPADRSSPTKASIARYRPTEAMRRVRRRPRLVAALTGPPNSTRRGSTRASRRALQSAVKLNPSWQPPLLAYTHASVRNVKAAEPLPKRQVRPGGRGGEVSEHARRRRGGVEEARSEEMRSGGARVVR